MWMDVYANLVYKFYSLLRFKTDARNNILDYNIKLWLHGKECRLTLEMLAKWLDCDHERILNTSYKFRLNKAWIGLTIQENYDPHNFVTHNLSNKAFIQFFERTK